MTEQTTTKESIRRLALDRRDNLPEKERVDFSNAIAHSTIALLRQWDESQLHCYLNFRSEVITRKLIESLLNEGIEIITPAMVAQDGIEIMEHVRLTSLQNLKIGRFGISEATGETVRELSAIDAVLLPLAAFDRTGTRVGYGRGFYDRFLENLSVNVKKVGLAFAIQEFPKLPREPHDIQMDVVITESEIIFCGEIA